MSAGLVVRALVLLLAVAGLQSWSVAKAPGPAEASTVTGTGGLFVPLTGRLISTQNGTNIAKAPLAANQWYTIQAGGYLGIPTTVSGRCRSR
jgi:hypothetical protein